MHHLSQYREVWLVDFEFRPSGGIEGSNPDVVCLVAHEFKSSRVIRLRSNEFGAAPPYPVGDDVLFVAYYASAEIGCHIALGWPLPTRILDLYCEFRNATNGAPGNRGIIGALMHYGLDHMGAHEKDEMRELILRGGPWSEHDWRRILDYCESDVAALTRLLSAMLSSIDFPRALLRGRYMASAARIEYAGVPIDVPALERIDRHRDSIKDRLIAEVDADFGVFDGHSFRAKQFAIWLASSGMPWPLDERGRLKLDDDTFRQMERSHPEIAPLHQLRSFLSENRDVPIPVGIDGRNRCLLSAFGSRTGRNQPSNSKAIFHRPAWNRSLIKPKPGMGLAYIDWEQQEVGIAAALSGDKALMAAYHSGDPYLEFGKQAGKMPPNATKKTHKAQRDRFKACVLAVQYGMGAESLAASIQDCSPFEAKELLRLHRETYPTFWKWSQETVDQAVLTGSLQTVFGWELHVPPNFNPRSLANFPMQANGAEMLRLACCIATEEGIKVCAPVHDAVLIEAPLDLLAAHVARMQAIMAEASRLVLDGFEIRTDVEIVRYPDRYMDDRGREMWSQVNRLIDELEVGDLLTHAIPLGGQVLTGEAGSSLLLSI